MLDLVASAVTFSAGAGIGGLAMAALGRRRASAYRSLARDLAQLQDAEARARAANRLLQTAEQVAQIGSWRLDVATGRLTCSDGVYRIHGSQRGAGKLDAERALSAYHSDDRRTIRELMAAAVRQGAEFEQSLRLVGPAGDLKHVVVRGVCERSDAGDVTALFGVVMDVTALRLAEQAAEVHDARYRLIAEAATDLFCRFAPDSTILWASPAAHAILGHRPEALLGQRLFDMMHPEDVSQVAAGFQRVIEGGPGGMATVWRYRARHRAGHWIWLEGRPSAAFDIETGSVIQLQDVIRDITARQETEDRLAAAQVAAEAAAAAKSEFLATMSHELRTPLTSIIGFAGLLQARGKLGETEARFVRRINDASRMLLTVVNDVLEFSKLEAGRTELESRVFSLRELVDDTAALVLADASEKGLALRSATHPLAPERLLGDPGRLRQVLLNLLNNAVKFTEAGSVELRVVVEASPPGLARLTFSISDTGPGIPADRMDRLFQRFSQADGSMSRRYGGTGLGLAICRGLIELMQGQIGVDSSEGQGSRFWFTVALPLAPALSTPMTQPTPDPERCPAGRVLVADDSEASRELIRLMVTALGHDVDLVEDGAAAVEAVQCGPAYDLILMDVHMPVLDGLLATRRIRALGSHRGALPIIALTADVLPEQIARCREAGMDDHVAKPILPALLAKSLTRWLDPASTIQSPRGELQGLAS